MFFIRSEEHCAQRRELAKRKLLETVSMTLEENCEMLTLERKRRGQLMCDMWTVNRLTASKGGERALDTWATGCNMSGTAF